MRRGSVMYARSHDSVLECRPSSSQKRPNRMYTSSIDPRSTNGRLQSAARRLDAALHRPRALKSVLAILVALSIFPPAAQAAQSVVKFAIFPSESIVPCFEDIDWWSYAVPVQKLLDEREDAELTYSFYADGSDKTILPPLRELWTSNVARRKPALDAVRTAARRLAVDAVIMTWIRCSQYAQLPPHLYRVEVYVVDVAQGRMYHARALSTWGGQAAAKAIDEFFANRATSSKN